MYEKIEKVLMAQLYRIDALCEEKKNDPTVARYNHYMIEIINKLIDIQQYKSLFSEKEKRK